MSENQSLSPRCVFSDEFITKMSEIGFYGDVTVVFTGGQITNAFIKQGFLDRDRQGNPVRHQIILLEQEI